jgi:hypothetical protein
VLERDDPTAFASVSDYRLVAIRDNIGLRDLRSNIILAKGYLPASSHAEANQSGMAKAKGKVRSRGQILKSRPSKRNGVTKNRRVKGIKDGKVSDVWPHSAIYVDETEQK